MLIDHVGMLFFPEHLLFRVVGRISFPIFAFLIAEGFEKTSNVRRYLFRLLAFAAISQVPYSLFMQASGLSSIRLNIFFTLSAGLLALMVFKRLPVAYSIPSIVLLSIVAEFASFDYGIYGILTVLASSLFLRFRAIGFLVLLGLPLLRTTVEFLSGFLSIQIYATLSAPFLMLYNGERGRQLPRLFLYGFYPVHLLVLLLIWFLIH